MITPDIESTSHSDDQAVALIRELGRQKRLPDPPRPALTRWIGVIIGALTGLAFALVAQSTNRIALPGVPFAHYPFGFTGNCLAAAVGGGLCGLLCAWPKGGLNGATLAGVGMILFLELRAWLIQATPLAVMIQTIFSPFILLAAALAFIAALPLMLLMRWGIDIQGELAHQPVWAWQRVRVPLLVLILAGCAGYLALYPREVRQALISTHTLIQHGLQAQAQAELPPVLRTQQVREFRNNANSTYTLEESHDNALRQDIVPLADLEDIVIVARFRNGWVLACVFEAGSYYPRCKSYEPQFAPGINDIRAFIATGAD
jgi:hypothetical protein